MKKIAQSFVLIALALAVVCLSSCKKDEENSNPTISSVTVNPATADANSMVNVTVTASDPDGDGLTYAYTVSGGAIQGNGATAVWTAPSQEGSYSVTVTVNDGNGGSASGNGSLVVVAPQTQITGTASFPAGTSGDLSNAKVSIYTSIDNWYDNSPIKFGTVSGSGASVTFTLPDLNPGNYYLDVWKDNDNNAAWSTGDFIGWFGSGGLGSPNLTEIQLSHGETVNVNISMFIIEGSPVTTSITGTATIAGGADGDLAGAKAFLYTSVDDWVNYNPLMFVVSAGSGTSVDFAFEDIDPGTYYLDVWQNNDNSEAWTVGDYIGIYGDIGTQTLYAISIVEGEVLDFDIDMYFLVEKSSSQSPNGKSLKSSLKPMGFNQ